MVCVMIRPAPSVRVLVVDDTEHVRRFLLGKVEGLPRLERELSRLTLAPSRRS